MKTSRQRVLEYINTHGGTTVAEISQALKMTPANARHHLSILSKAGHIKLLGQRPVEGQGRPANVFGPSDQVLGNNLDRLAGALLDDILSENDPKTKLEGIAEKLARTTAKNHKQSRPLNAVKPHLTQRLYEAVSHLNKLNYQARWEAHRQSPRIILEHCPYYAIIQDHPELCQIDAHLLSTLLLEPVEQINKLAKDRRGRTHCTFRIRQITH